MAELMLVNPKKRRRGRPKVAKAKAKRRRRTGVRRSGKRLSLRRHSGWISNPKRRRSRKFRRNPIGGFNIKSFANNTLMPAAIGGIGAVGLDVILAMLPLPAAVKTGPMKPIAKIAGAVGIGMIASMVAGRKFGEQVTAGAVTVTLYEIIKELVQKAMPTLPLTLKEYDDDLSYIQSGQVLQDNGVSAYISDDTISEYDTNYDEMSAYVS